MKDRNKWLTDYEENSAFISYIKVARQNEIIEKKRKHFQTICNVIERFSTLYGNIFLHSASTLSVQDTNDVEVIKVAHDTISAFGIKERQIFSEVFHDILYALMPWRKGPFNLFDTFIDAEWRSDIKWKRCKHIFDIESLCKNKVVLDIGANNMYYALRIVEAQARMMLAIDPMPKYAHYYDLFSLLMPHIPLYFEMIGVPLHESMTNMFDTIFCMGIMYHQRNPLLCLQSLHKALKQDGVLVLETICLNREDDVCLFPEKTYQNSKGYWFIPSFSVVRHWLTRCNFEILAYDEPVLTTSQEQRKTAWIDTHSLEHFLTADKTKTIEGYEAPHRCVVIARKR